MKDWSYREALRAKGQSATHGELCDIDDSEEEDDSEEGGYSDEYVIFSFSPEMPKSAKKAKIRELWENVKWHAPYVFTGMAFTFAILVTVWIIQAFLAAGK